MASDRVQRRLAAILSADVVGYSRLMGVDEAGTLSQLKTHRKEIIDPKIAKHRGRIVKLSGRSHDSDLISVSARCANLFCIGKHCHELGVRHDAQATR